MKPLDVAAPIIDKKRLAFCSAVKRQQPTKMSTNPKKEESDKQKTEDVEVKIVPEGTFAGTIEKPIIVKKGEPSRKIQGIKVEAKTEPFADVRETATLMITVIFAQFAQELPIAKRV